MKFSTKFIIVGLIIQGFIIRTIVNDNVEHDARMKSLDSTISQFETYQHRKIEAQNAKNVEKEITCLAKNIYFESRGLSQKEQLAVGFVTFNRLKSKRYPDTLCQVINQYKQFSWTLRKNKQIKEKRSWEKSLILAEKLYFNRKHLTDPTKGATHFYNPQLANPKWAKKGKDVIKMAGHIYMKIEK